MNILHYVVVVQTEDVNIAIEVSRKSKKAFVAANLLLEEAQNRVGINSVRRVIDFSFQYVHTACTFWFNSLVVLQFFFPFGLTYSVTRGGYAFTNVCICID